MTRTMVAFNPITSSNVSSSPGHPHRVGQVARRIRDHIRSSLDSDCKHTNWLVSEIIDWTGVAAHYTGYGILIRRMDGNATTPRPVGKEWFITFTFEGNAGSPFPSEIFESNAAFGDRYMRTDATNSAASGNFLCGFAIHYNPEAPAGVNARNDANTSYRFDFPTTPVTNGYAPYDHGCHGNSVLNVDSGSKVGSFTVGEIIEQASSGARAVFIADNGSTFDVMYIVGRFVKGDQISGIGGFGLSASGATINAGAVPINTYAEGSPWKTGGGMALDLVSGEGAGTFTPGEILSSPAGSAYNAVFVQDNTTSLEIAFTSYVFDWGDNIVVYGEESGAWRRVSSASPNPTGGSFGFVTPANTPRSSMSTFYPDNSLNHPRGIISEDFCSSFPSLRENILHLIFDDVDNFICSRVSHSKMNNFRNIGIVGDIIRPVSANIDEESTTTGQITHQTTTTFTLGHPAASAADSFYVDYWVVITKGSGVGQRRKITAYVGATKLATISAAWGENPSTDSEFKLQLDPYVEGSMQVTYSQYVEAFIAQHLPPNEDFYGISARYGNHDLVTHSRDFFTWYWNQNISLNTYRRKYDRLEFAGATPANLNGKYFIMYTDGQSVAFWFNIDNGATTEPDHVAYRSFEIFTVNTGDTPAQIATKVATALAEWRPGFEKSTATGQLTHQTNTTFILGHPKVSSTDDYYNNNSYTIALVTGTGSGQVRTISDFNGTTKLATISSGWTTNPDSTTQYELYFGTITNPWATATVVSSTVVRAGYVFAGYNGVYDAKIDPTLTGGEITQTVEYSDAPWDAITISNNNEFKGQINTNIVRNMGMKDGNYRQVFKAAGDEDTVFIKLGENLVTPYVKNVAVDTHLRTEALDLNLHGDTAYKRHDYRP